MVWFWVVGGLVVWLVVATALALLIGRGIRLADRRSSVSEVPLTTADLPPSFVLSRPPIARRTIPLPPVGMALAGLAVTLETTGYLARLDGGTGGVLSMDAPLSLPRMYVAALFAAAAVAGIAAANTIPGRRTWWLAVALVSAGISAVKAGGTVHARAMAALNQAVGARAAVVLSAAAALTVVSALWFLSRTERRDRRRVLGALVGYAVASVGLSALSAAVPSAWTATATFVEESGEALGGVAFLIAVLVGVAPRLVLPSGWPLRRRADAYTLDVPQTSRLRPGDEGTASI